MGIATLRRREARVSENRPLIIETTRCRIIYLNNQFVLRNQVYTDLDLIRGVISSEQVGCGGEAYIVAAGAASTCSSRPSVVLTYHDCFN